ncbi:MAG: 3'-5' exonuclease [Elusimicrobia bacterium]|nr:3'-5' exonuclease [Elusimicrobiota bacterium]
MPLAPLTRPIVFFDLETTGLLVELDRIIEIGLIKLFPDGRTERLVQRFNPSMRIPQESIAIHGITNDMLKDQPAFRDWAPRLFEIFEDADIGGFSLNRLDIPMLTKEFTQAGFAFSMDGRRIADASKIFREKEPRNLTAAYRFYCGKDLVGAHSAGADAEASYEVFLAQLDRYGDLPKEMNGIHRFCTAPGPSQVDLDGRLVWRDGEAYFNFGKHRFHKLAAVVQEDPDYIKWIVEKADFSPDFVEICRQSRRGIFPRQPPSALPKKP